MAYYETHLLARRFFPGLTFEVADTDLSEQAEVLWLDTSSTEWSAMPARAERARVMVVDTTCVEADSSVVSSWLAESERLDCPLVLIRSHLKLDTFGLELGKLGSIMVISPDRDGHRIEELLHGLRRARALFGLGYELAHLYPGSGPPSSSSSRGRGPMRSVARPISSRRRSRQRVLMVTNSRSCKQHTDCCCS